MRLAVYGTLRRGGSNHHVVAGISGTWAPGTVRGWVYELTWGPAAGYPGLTLDPDGAAVPVDVLTTDDLDRHLPRLDRFEGDGYRRIVTSVTLDDGEVVDAWLYEAIAED
ncbi:MAG: gamma-glutamylcyclotransferase family protein [Acidimicrobiia bacterium]